MDVLNWNPPTSFDNWKGKGFGSRGNTKLSTCQDLVIVPGGPDWVIRELNEKFPECCWKFAATSSIAQYHFAQAVKPAPSKRSTPSIPVFFATLPHFYSPTDFSVQPKYLDEFRNRICEEMEDEYREKSMPKMDHDHVGLKITELVIGVACATFNGQRWVRTRILKRSGLENAFAEFVDFGITKIVPISDLYRLKKRFGKVPPMALHCRIQDVYVNDLDAHKVDAFQKMIVDCGNIVRVELVALDEPYVVNLYHPTIIGINLATSFYRTDAMAAKQLYIPVIDDPPNDKDDDDYTDDESSEIDDDDEQEIAQVTVIRSLPKAPKIFRAALQTLIIANFENACCVFLHESNQIDRRIRMEAKMKKMFLEKSLHALPSEWITLSAACVFVEERNEGLQIHRATIESVEANYVELFFCDLGFWKRLTHEATRKQLYALSEEFSDEPMVYVISLTDRGRYPHPNLTAELKELTNHSTKVKFEPERGSKHMPIKGILSNDLHNDLLREAEERWGGNLIDKTLAETSITIRLESKRINVKTWALLPYNQSPLHDIISRFIDLSFIHHPYPPHSFCRGSLSFEILYMNE